MWAELNREALREAGVDGDVAFFTRSGFTTSPSHSTLAWLGDQVLSPSRHPRACLRRRRRSSLCCVQMTTWDTMDGLGSAVMGLITSGFAGYSLTHSDIGGYTMISNAIVTYNRSQELLQRWTEMNAFSDAMFRSHLGVIPQNSVQFYTNDATFATFATFSRVHTAMGVFRTGLMQEAAATGMPLVRHMWLQFPQDPATFDLTQQVLWVAVCVCVCGACGACGVCGARVLVCCTLRIRECVNMCSVCAALRALVTRGCCVGVGLAVHGRRRLPRRSCSGARGDAAVCIPAPGSLDALVDRCRVWQQQPRRQRHRRCTCRTARRVPLQLHRRASRRRVALSAESAGKQRVLSPRGWHHRAATPLQMASLGIDK
jgi:hypothetical protein